MQKLSGFLVRNDNSSSKFVHSPIHPSLQLEKLGGTKLWTIRIDRGNRVFFTWIDEKKALLIDIGKHDKYRKY